MKLGLIILFAESQVQQWTPGLYGAAIRN